MPRRSKKSETLHARHRQCQKQDITVDQGNAKRHKEKASSPKHTQLKDTRKETHATQSLRENAELKQQEQQQQKQFQQASNQLAG